MLHFNLDCSDCLGAFDLSDMADREKDRRFGEAMHRHVQQAREIGERPAHAEGEHNDAHVLDRRVAEHPLDIVAAVEHEASEDERGKPHSRHQWSGRDGTRIGGEQKLKSQHGVERDIEQQA